MPSFTFMSLLPQIILVNLQKNLEHCDFQEMEIDKSLKQQLSSRPYLISIVHGAVYGATKTPHIHQNTT